jgi:hypothetical protein
MKINDRDLTIWNNIISRIGHVPDRETVMRKYNEAKAAGLFDIPGSRVVAVFHGGIENAETDKIWAVVSTVELNNFFITLEKKYNFNGHTHTIDKETGEIIPIPVRRLRDNR